jgi:hypothetical protein
MNMTAVNPALGGGPVGGMMMNNNNTGSPAMQMNQSQEAHLENLKVSLNTYIYEYLLRIGLFDAARQLHQSQDKFKMRTITKPSPNSRKNGEVNGLDDSMDIDIPDDLPRPACPGSDPNGQGFLFEWFGIFTDLLAAARPQKQGAHLGPAAQYLNYTQASSRL